jgi:hypothetical protein
MTQRYDSFGIVIEGQGGKPSDRTEFERSVKWHLDLIQRSQTGLALLRAIRATGKTITISPWTDTGINASTRPLDWPAATPEGELVLDPSGRPKTTGKRKDVMIGTGAGSDVEIRYSPDMWGFGGSAATSFAPTLPGIGPTAVLFHEMCHGYRITRGHRYSLAMMGGRVQYDNREEFFAVVLSNIFVTDPTTLVQGRTLRADHWGFTPLAAAQATSQSFLQVPQNQQLIAQLFTQEPTLTNDLMKVNATFNPVQQYFQLPAFPTLGP